MKIATMFAIALACLTLGNCASLGEALVEASEDTDVAPIWRGLKHEWQDEVHRTGRIGSWVEVEDSEAFPKDVSIHHVAQSGTAADDATYSVIYDMVQATHTRFVPGTVVIPVSVREEVNFHFEEHVAIEATEAAKLKDKDLFVAVLNGFDLETNTAAKKLGHLDVRLTQPVKFAQNIEFDVVGDLMMSCASTECDTQKNRVDYDLTIHYLLVASKADSAHFVEHERLSNSYDYDSRDTVPESLGNIHGTDLSPPLDNGYQTSALAMTFFSFDVSKDTSLTKPDPVPHLFAWKMWMRHRGALTIAPEVDGQLFFSHDKAGWSNVGHDGHVEMSFDPISLQFKTGIKKACEWEATRPFGNASSGTTEESKSAQINDPGNFACV